MNHAGSKTSCAMWCMIIGGAIGLIAFLLLWLVIDWSVLSSLMLGGVIAAVGAVVFPIVFCSNSTGLVEPGSAGVGPGSAPTAADAKPKAAAPTTSSTPAAAANTATATTTAAASTSASVQPSKFLAGEAELSEKKGEWKYEAEDKPAAKKPAAKKAADKKPAAKKPAAKSAVKAKAAPVAKDGQPPLLSKARDGGADDLKQIKGVGPGLEKTLNELGFYHFDQIAGWRKKEIAWVDERLKFKGRIERDDWVKQCKTLAKGGATEFSNRVKKGDVY